MPKQYDLTPPPGHRFDFTRRWFLARNHATFVEHIHPVWADKPNLVYLEIGVFEGMSMSWMLTHILTGEGSYGVGVDPWLMTTKISAEEMDAVRTRAERNCSPWICNVARRDGGEVQWRCTLHRANSYDFLRRCRRRRAGFGGIRPGGCDLILIDGNHFDFGALDDARQSLELARPGGWLIFDDVENQIPKEGHVKHGLATFLEEAGDRVKFVAKHRYIEIYEKVK